MNKIQAKAIDTRVLRKYKVLASDRNWVQLTVSKAIDEANMDWTNYKSKAATAYNSSVAMIENRFAERFPTYADEVLAHTVKGRSWDKFVFGIFLTWLISLVVSFVLIFLEGPGLFFGVLFIGGMIVTGSISLLIFKLSVADSKPMELIEKREQWVNEMSSLLGAEVNQQTTLKFFSSTSSNLSELAKSVNHSWQPLGPRPIAESDKLTPRSAELYVAAYMTFYGARGVVATRFSRDGGIDVESDFFAAQVKHQASKVGVRAVRELFGVASVVGKKPMFFTKSGFTKEAVEFANSVKMPLFVYIPHLQASNLFAQAYLRSGMGSEDA